MCQAQQASCDGALLARYLPDANNGPDKGCRRRVTTGRAAEVTPVQTGVGDRLLLVPVMAAPNILQPYFSARPDLLSPEAGTPSDPVFMLLIYGLFQLSSVSANDLVCCFVSQSNTPDSRIPNGVGALRVSKWRACVCVCFAEVGPKRKERKQQRCNR